MLFRSGMNGSPLYTLLLRQNGVRGVYSIGRVQTPTLYMVYQRDQAIKNFKPEPYFELNAEILANQQKFVAKLDPYQRFKDEKGLLAFMSEKRLEKGSQSGLIKDVQKQTKKTSSPRLFSLSSLQSEINKRYHASASDTLQAVQNLYEAKLLTYPRTDSNYITEQEFNYLVENLNGYLGFLSKDVSLTHQEPNKRYVNGKKVQEHHAIIMTKTVPTQENMVDQVEHAAGIAQSSSCRHCQHHVAKLADRRINEDKLEAIGPESLDCGHDNGYAANPHGKGCDDVGARVVYQAGNGEAPANQHEKLDQANDRALQQYRGYVAGNRCWRERRMHLPVNAEGQLGRLHQKANAQKRHAEPGIPWRQPREEAVKRGGIEGCKGAKHGQADKDEAAAEKVEEEVLEGFTQREAVAFVGYCQIERP